MHSIIRWTKVGRKLISPGTYGVITSVLMKAHPPINMTSSSFTLSVNTKPSPAFNFTPPFPSNFTGNWTGNWTLPSYNFSLPRVPGFSDPLNDTELFWSGVSAYYRHGINVINAGGYTYGYLYPRGNNSYTFSSSATFFGKTSAQATALMQPLYDELNRIGIKQTNPPIRNPFPYAGFKRGAGGESIANTRYRSRLFPRENWEDDGLWNDTMSAIRTSIEAGYTFHTQQYGPTEEVAGWPGQDSGVNPAWRTAALHASLMEVQPTGLSAAQAKTRDAQAEKYLDLWRAVSPGSGAYMNEGDPGEPNWQQSFYGDKYDRLLEIKRKWDPWGLFWAPTTVGSEGWEVRTSDGYPCSQNGRLCRASTQDEDSGDDDDDRGDDQWG